MSIKLSDYIKDVENVFTEEEAKMIYENSGYTEIKDSINWKIYSDFLESINTNSKIKFETLDEVIKSGKTSKM